MATLDWNLTRTGEVTLVELLVTTETRREIQLESSLAPVWPPRRQGQPVAGWDGTTFTAVVDAEERLVVGYASPAAPDGKPAELETAPPTETDERDTIDPQALVRALGEARPPRDLLAETITERPVEESGETTQASQQQRASRAVAASSTEKNQRSGPKQPPNNTRPEAPIPGTTTSYFGAVEDRLTEAKQLATAESSEEARAAVSATGGIEAVEQLQTTLEADRERLAAIGNRSQRLSEQLDEVEIPVATLERLV